MNEARVYRYYGTPDPMSEKEAYHCTKYLKRRKAEIIRFGRFLIDRPALLTMFHLDCVNCKSAHGATCCEAGQPYSVEAWQRRLIERETPAVAKRYLDGRPIPENRSWDLLPGSIPMHEGNCFYYAKIGDCHGCSLHAYAEAGGEPVYPLKPFSCQLYPLDLIRIGEQTLITAITGETAAFSRWGTDYLEQFFCASQPRREAATHLQPDWFALDGYRPAYCWGMDILREAFGKEVAEVVQAVCSA